MLTDHARAIQRVCFDSDPSEADLERLGSPERWLVYRELVRNRMVGVIEAALPRTRAAVGAEAFQRVMDEWLSNGGPKTRYLRRVPNELAELGIPIWRDGAEAWVADLARYEIASWSVRHAPPNPIVELDFTFERYPVVGPAVRVLRLNHSVHEAPTPESGYARSPVLLCLHRNDAHRAAHRTLNPLAADLLMAWQRGEETVAESVQRVADTHASPITPEFVDKLSTLITTFLTEGILLGGQDARARSPAG